VRRTDGISKLSDALESSRTVCSLELPVLLQLPLLVRTFLLVGQTSGRLEDWTVVCGKRRNYWSSRAPSRDSEQCPSDVEHVQEASSPAVVRLAGFRLLASAETCLIANIEHGPFDKMKEINCLSQLI